MTHGGNFQPAHREKIDLQIYYTDVSENGGFSPKSSILYNEFSIIKYPFWGPTPIFGNTHTELLFSKHNISDINIRDPIKLLMDMYI